MLYGVLKIWLILKLKIKKKWQNSISKNLDLKLVLIEIFKLGGMVALEDKVAEMQSNFWLNFGDFPPTILSTQKLKRRFSIRNF